MKAEEKPQSTAVAWARKFVLGMAIGGASMGAMAFNDGVAGVTSTGSFDVRLLLGQTARVWGLNDVDFATAAGGEKENFDLCLYSLSERVSLKVSGNFELKDTTNNNTLNYIVTVKGINQGDGIIGSGTTGNAGDPNATATWGNANATTPVDNLGGATHNLYIAAQKSDAVNCAGNENLNVEIAFETPSAPFVDGIYTDQITLEVEPG